MEKSERAAQRARVIALRDAAVDMVRMHGRVVGNIERGGHTTRIAMLDRGRLRIEFWEKKPTTYLIEMRWEAGAVLRVGWDGDRLNLIRTID